MVRKGRFRPGLLIPVVLSAFSTAGRPTRLISMSAAVLSLIVIILVAAPSTVIWVPSGSF